MQAGQLRHRVTLQQPTNVEGDEGEYTQQWVDVAELDAFVEPVSASESFFVEQVNNEVTHKITIRAYEGIKPTWRFVFMNRVLNIDRVTTPKEQLHFQIAFCIENLSLDGTGEAGDANYGPGGTYTFTTDVWDFTQTQEQFFVVPDGKRFYPDSVEPICRVKTTAGVVSVQPTFVMGTDAQPTLVLSRQTTKLSDVKRRQKITTFNNDDGLVGTFRVGISVVGVISTGQYKGKVIIKGTIE